MLIVYTFTYFCFFNPMPMRLVCPECKNDVDLSPYPNLVKDQIIECNFCGITLMIANTSGDQLLGEVVDEGK